MSDRTDVIGFYEARTRLSELLDGVERGRSVVITRHGKPIAMLAALPEQVTDGTTESDVVEALLAYRKSRKAPPGKLNVREMIEAGRRR
jgi:antitoxin (DNA-binding transcriptional repressor) of toxin-antitoxin stability system